MFKIVFLFTLIAFHAFTWGSKNFWLDDIDEPKFLRGVEQQTNLQKELDDTNASPDAAQAVIHCRVASHSKGVKTTPSNKPPVDANKPDIAYGCGTPHPTVVQLKIPGSELIPSAIILHRCVGGCFQQLIENCTVTSQEELKINVHEITGGKPFQKTMIVYNHTGCGCDCITRSSDCNEANQTYDQFTCSCQCIQDGSSCDPVKQNWNDRTCQCECKMSAHNCDRNSKWNDQTCQCECKRPPLQCDKNREWNSQTCQCDLCAQKVKNRCARKVKVLNKKTCECECPKPQPTCLNGTTFLKHNCSCV